MQSIKYTQYFEYDHEGVFFLIAKTCSEFKDIAVTRVSNWVWGFIPFYWLFLWLTSVTERKFYVQSELFTLIQCMFI